MIEWAGRWFLPILGAIVVLGGLAAWGTLTSEKDESDLIRVCQELHATFVDEPEARCVRGGEVVYP